MSQPEETRQHLRDIYDQITVPMVLLSLVWLLLFSTLLPHDSNADLRMFGFWEMKVLLVLGMLVHMVFVADYLLFAYCAWPMEDRWHRLGFGFIAMMFPIARIGQRTFSRPLDIYIPMIGWHRRNRALEKRLEKNFGLPIFILVLLVIPLLALELFRKDDVYNPAVDGIIFAGSQVVWLAFTLEFSIMLSVAHKKMQYATAHVIDLLIILVPIFLLLLPLMALLPVARLARLSNLARSTKLMRVRGASRKAFRALVLLAGTLRFGKKFHDQRIRRLRRKIREKQLEVKDMKEEIELLKAELEGDQEREKEKREQERFDKAPATQ